MCLSILFLQGDSTAAHQQRSGHYPVGGPSKRQSASPSGTLEFKSHVGDVPDQIIRGLSHAHGLTLRCRDEEPVSPPVNPPPGLKAPDLTPACLDVWVIWGSGGQVCQMGHLWVNVFTNVGSHIWMLGRLSRYAYFRRGDLFSCSHLWAAVYFKPFKSSIQKMHYPNTFPSFNCSRKLWDFQHITPYNVSHETEQCHAIVPVFAPVQELLQRH